MTNLTWNVHFIFTLDRLNMTSWVLRVSAETCRNNLYIFILIYTSTVKRLRWSRGSVLAFRTRVRGFPCRSFTARKGSLNVTCKSAFRQNYGTHLAHSSTFHRWVLSRGDMRKLERLTQIAQ